MDKVYTNGFHDHTTQGKMMDTTLALCRDENTVPSVVASRKNLAWQDLGLANDLEPPIRTLCAK